MNQNQSNASVEPPKKRSLWHQPAGVYLVSATEFWERFSYYGMTAMLVLFLSSAIPDGGLGWSRDEALHAYGIFGGAAFALPALGGWICDRWLGHHRGVVGGGLGILAGNAALFAAGYVLGEMRTILAMAGLALVVFGTGLLKPAVSALIGGLYDSEDGDARQAGYTLFMMGIWLGSIGGTIFSGAFGEALGWRWGFLASAIGMALGLCLYPAQSDRLIGTMQRQPQAEIAANLQKGSVPGAGLAIACMTFFTAIYAIAFYQKAGVLTLMVRDSTDRLAFGATIPAALFLTVSTVGFVLLAPVAQLIDDRLAARGRRPDIFMKQAAGLAALLIGYLFFIGAATESANGALHSPLWIVAGYLFFSVGDVLIWPPQISTISRIAPAHRVGLLIGVWYVTVGVGNYMAGWLGPLASEIGQVSYFISIQALLGVSIVLLLVVRWTVPALRRAADPDAE